VQIRASLLSGGRSLSQHSQLGRSSSIMVNSLSVRLRSSSYAGHATPLGAKRGAVESCECAGE